MDPISGLALACNIIDLVDKAIKCGATVIEVYNSTDGRHQVQRSVNDELNGLADVVKHLHLHQSQLTGHIRSSKVSEAALGIVQCCTQLHAVLDNCKAKQPGSLFSAAGATLKFLKKKNEIGRLQQELTSSRKELDSWVAIYTHTHVERVLHSIDDLGIRHSQLGTHLDSIGRNLTALKDAVHSDREGGLAQDSTQNLRSAQEAVADGMIIELLHFQNYGQRFQELREGSGIFHIAGKLGSGKSTLMKYLCSHAKLSELLTEWAGGKKLVFAKFFFWRMGTSQEEKSLRGLIQGLLYEILCAVPSLANSLFPQTRAKLVKGTLARNGAELIAAELKDAFARLVNLSAFHEHASSFEKVRICFFIDGLDEFDDSGLGETHGELVDTLLRWTANSDGNIKICTSSRTQGPFIGRLPSSQRITLNRLTMGDIERFVSDRLEGNNGFRDLEAIQRHNLVQDVLRVAEGVFLSAALVVKSLLNGLDNLIPISRLREQIAKTPPKLEDLLARIFEKLSEEYGDSVDILLATILRSSGILLSPEDRDLNHVAFDERLRNSNIFGMRSYGFSLSSFGCFLVLTARDLGKEISSRLDIADLQLGNRFREDASNQQIYDFMTTAILSRCVGLVEVIDGRDVKFTHRSIPEFLQGHLKRAHSGSHRLNDCHITLTMAWAYLMEAAYESAEKIQGWSIVDYFLGRKAAVSTKASRLSIRNRVVDQKDNVTRSKGKCQMWLRGSKSGRCSPQRKRAWNRLDGLLRRLRQLRLNEGYEEVFRILVKINGIYYQTWRPHYNIFSQTVWFPSGDSNRWDQWALLSLAADLGHHEFIEWVFSYNQLPETHDGHLLAMSAMAMSLGGRIPVDFTLKAMETIFRLGLPADARLPPGVPQTGTRLWHFVLSQFIDYKCHDSYSNIIELWLKEGADPRVRLTSCMSFRHVRSHITGHFERSSMRYDAEKDEGELLLTRTDLSLNTYILMRRPQNCQALLDLINEKTSPNSECRRMTSLADSTIQVRFGNRARSYERAMNKLRGQHDDRGLPTKRIEADKRVVGAVNFDLV
ncbi:hypothetical protein NM208_g6294 [Fusarium decemcellulare]|uniref:Uncharacterized protein n=1 Tax=Fusarium decemcellulare TaxID=57161 RepID=A0ACC1SDU0_9HYPO|nr:hypothetical protein NM208_g6294 [Fusarium decemcellulare]